MKTEEDTTRPASEEETSDNRIANLVAAVSEIDYIASLYGRSTTGVHKDVGLLIGHMMLGEAK